MRKVKVLHVSAGGLGTGGVSSVIFSIVESLYKSIDFSCIVFSKKCSRESDFCKFGKLFRIQAYGGNFIEKFLRPFILTYSIWRICYKEHFDVIHCHNNHDQAFCILGAYLAGVPMRIAHSHTKEPDGEIPLHLKVYCKICFYIINYFATNKIGCSESACKYLFNGKYQVINNSFGINRFHWSYKDFSRPLRFVNVGRYCSNKNQEFVLEVFDIIRRKYKDATLSLVGTGRNKDKLECLIRSLGLEQSVKMFSSDSEHMPNVYYNSDIMIFPSRGEGFGIVLLEAQASGCFCFVSDQVPNNADVGFLQYLSLNLGANKWADTIIEFVEKNEIKQNEQILNKLQKFSQNYISKIYLNLYESVDDK